MERRAPTCRDFSRHAEKKRAELRTKDEATAVLGRANHRDKRTLDPEILPYWNRTYYILIRHHDGIVSKYAELEKVNIKVGDFVRGGQVIARVGSVLNPEKITDASPSYIRRLGENGNQSMLHFELYEGTPARPADYLGGNSFSVKKPKNLLDATSYLKCATR